VEVNIARILAQESKAAGRCRARPLHSERRCARAVVRAVRGRARRAPADRRHVEGAHIRLADVQVEVDALEQGPHVQAETAAHL
jgi:hypothetical protein